MYLDGGYFLFLLPGMECVFYNFELVAFITSRKILAILSQNCLSSLVYSSFLGLLLDFAPCVYLFYSPCFMKSLNVFHVFTSLSTVL
jgi:hypothetical protein